MPVLKSFMQIPCDMLVRSFVLLLGTNGMGFGSPYNHFGRWKSMSTIRVMLERDVLGDKMKVVVHEERFILHFTAPIFVSHGCWH